MAEQKNKKRRCENCGAVMKQQFIGLKHCKCGTSWQKGVGYFQRTDDMVFALERKVTQKGKNSVRTKQVPVIRYKEADEPIKTRKCITCKNDVLKTDGCKPFLYSTDGKTKYARIKVGEAGDMYEGGGADSRCTDCGAKNGHSHHFNCDCERCPVCGGQLITCGCSFFDTPN